MMTLRTFKERGANYTLTANKKARKSAPLARWRSGYAEDCKSTTPRRFSSNVRSCSPFVPARDSAGLRGALRTFLAPPASAPKADLTLGIVTIFLRTHRVVHRRIPIGYGRIADTYPSPTQHEKG